MSGRRGSPSHRARSSGAAHRWRSRPRRWSQSGRAPVGRRGRARRPTRGRSGPATSRTSRATPGRRSPRPLASARPAARGSRPTGSSRHRGRGRVALRGEGGGRAARAARSRRSWAARRATCGSRRRPPRAAPSSTGTVPRGRRSAPSCFALSARTTLQKIALAGSPRDGGTVATRPSARAALSTCPRVTARGRRCRGASASVQGTSSSSALPLRPPPSSRSPTSSVAPTPDGRPGRTPRPTRPRSHRRATSSAAPSRARFCCSRRTGRSGRIHRVRRRAHVRVHGLVSAVRAPRRHGPRPCAGQRAVRCDA